MNTDLTFKAKFLISGVSIVSVLFVAPILWGLILLLTQQVYQAPWPAVAVFCTIGLVWVSWLVLWNRMKSTLLATLDVVVPIGLFLGLIGANLPTPLTAWEWSSLIYVVCLIEVVIHSILALFAGLGVNITVGEATQQTKQATA